MTDGEPKTVVSASLQKTKSIKNLLKHFFSIFYFIKSETSDSFVNHFDGHFAYLKTLDFYFKDKTTAITHVFQPCNLHTHTSPDVLKASQLPRQAYFSLL